VCSSDLPTVEIMTLRRTPLMNEDRVIGNAKNVGGRVEEGFGRAAGDVKSQVQGKAKQAEGAVAARWPLRRTTLAEDPGSTRPERHFPSGAAQTRVVSAARIRLDPRKSVRSYKGIIYGDISEIAVGTLITERPPHRTERAPFGHSAPTSGI